MTSSISSGPFVGVIVRHLKLEDLAVAETTYAPNLVISEHCHPFHYFCAVLQGGFDDVTAVKRRSCRKTMIYFRPAEQVHADRFEGSGARCLTVEVRPQLVERLGEARHLLDWTGEFFGGPVFHLTRRIHNELQERDEFSALSIEGLVLELISEAARSSVGNFGNVPQWLRTVLEILASRSKEPLSLEDVARTVRVHPTHLARVFRRVCGCSVGEYLRRKRVEFCCKRLAERDQPLADIALEAGFADQSHFCRTFQRVVGESPGAYRKKILGSR